MLMGTRCSSMRVLVGGCMSMLLLLLHQIIAFLLAIPLQLVLLSIPFPLIPFTRLRPLSFLVPLSLLSVPFISAFWQAHPAILRTRLTT